MLPPVFSAASRPITEIRKPARASAVHGLTATVSNHNVALKRSAFASSGVADGVTL